METFWKNWHWRRRDDNSRAFANSQQPVHETIFQPCSPNPSMDIINRKNSNAECPKMWSCVTFCSKPGGLPMSGQPIRCNIRFYACRLVIIGRLFCKRRLLSTRTPHLIWVDHHGTTTHRSTVKDLFEVLDSSGSGRLHLNQWMDIASVFGEVVHGCCCYSMRLCNPKRL